MKRIGVFLTSFFLIFQSSLLAYSSNPKDFVNELVNDAIGKLSDKNNAQHISYFLVFKGDDIIYQVEFI